MATYREQIKQFFAKTFKGWYIEVTRPKKFLLDCGIPNLPIVIKPTTLKQKIEKHNLTKDDLQSLNTLINSALIVFHSPSEGKYYSAFNIITERKDEKGFLCVVVYINEEINRVEINNIASIHYRNINSIIKWVEDGYLINSNIEKIRKVFSGSLHNASKFEYLVSLLDAANIQNNSLSGAYYDELAKKINENEKLREKAVNSEFCKKIIAKYGKEYDDKPYSVGCRKYYPDAKTFIEEKCYYDARCSEKKPFPKDWKRVVWAELPSLVKDGDLIGEHTYSEFFNDGLIFGTLYVTKEYRRVCIIDGKPYYYLCDDENGEPSAHHEYKYGHEPDFILPYIINGKAYEARSIECRNKVDFDLCIYYIKPRTTAPTNSRLRLLKIQAQAKLKLQQQRMRAGVSGTELIYF